MKIIKEYQFLIGAALVGIIISTTLFLIEKRKDVHNDKALRICEMYAQNAYSEENRFALLIECLKDYAIKPYFHKNWKELKKISKE